MDEMEVLKEIQKVLEEAFPIKDYVSIKFLEKSLFDRAILNEIAIEPAGEGYESLGMGGYAEYKTDEINFNINLIKKQDITLESFINEKDKIIKALYCKDLLGNFGIFRSFKINTQPLTFSSDEVVHEVNVYKIEVLAKVR